MEYLNEVTLICIILINFISISVFCFLNMSKGKYLKKKNIIVGIVLLAVVLIFDIVCIAYFALNGRADDILIFGGFMPLIIYLLYETIKELWITSR